MASRHQRKSREVLKTRDWRLAGLAAAGISLSAYLLVTRAAHAPAYCPLGSGCDVECDPRGTRSSPQLCIAKGIKAFPTWDIVGRRLEGSAG